LEWDPKRPGVSKVHSPKWIEENMPSSVDIFTTSQASSDLSTAKYLREKGYNVRLTMNTDDLGKRGYYGVYEYQQVLGLNDDSMEVLLILQVLGYTSRVLRCLPMIGDSNWTRIQGTTFHRSSHSPSYGACEMYNITAVELAFRSSMLVKLIYKLGLDPTLQVLLRPSQMGSVYSGMDGTYCEGYNGSVALHT
jgi:hypothetical protein